MKLNKLERSGNSVTLEVEVDLETLELARDKVLNDTKKEVRLPGFRPGKTPNSVLEKRLGKEYFHEKTVDEALNSSYFQIVQENSLEPVDYPVDLKILKNEAGQPLVYSLRVEVKPDVKVTPELIKKAAVEIKRQKIGQDEVNKSLESIQNSMASFENVTERGVENSDLVKMEMKATLNGEPVAEWTMENAGLKIGDGLILKEFDDQLLDLKIGQEKNISLEFPAQYPLPKAAGKKVDFQVKIKEIMGAKKPELNDELAKKAGNFATLEDLKKQIMTDLEARVAETSRYEAGQAVIKNIAQQIGLEIPAAMIKRRVEFLKNNFEEELTRSGVKLPDYLKYINKTEDAYLADLAGQAASELKADLILESVARTQNFVVSQEEMAAEINVVARNMNQDPVQLNNTLDANALANIRSFVILRKSIDYLIENAEVKYVDQ